MGRDIMEIVNTILIAIGLIILGWHQKYKIKGLEDQIKSQSEILDSHNKHLEFLKGIDELLNPKKQLERVNAIEELVEKKSDYEIENYKNQMKEQHKESTDAASFFLKVYVSTLQVLYRIMYYVHPDIRKKIIEKIEDEDERNGVLKASEKIPFIFENNPLLASHFSRTPLGTGNVLRSNENALRPHTNNALSGAFARPKTESDDKE